MNVDTVDFPTAKVSGDKRLFLVLLLSNDVDVNGIVCPNLD